MFPFELIKINNRIQSTRFWVIHFEVLLDLYDEI